MRKVLSALAATGVAVALTIESPAQTAAPATRPAVVTPPTTMLSAMLTSARPTRTSPPVRPPLRRGYNPPDASALAVLRARAAAASQRAATGLASTAPSPQNVTVVMAATRPATRPAAKPTPLKIDLDNADNAALTAAFGVPVSLQGPRRMTGPRAWTIEQAAPLTYHGPAGTYAAAAADFFNNSGLTVVEGYSNLTLSAGKPMRVLNLDDAGTLVLTRMTLQARRNLRNETLMSYDYRVEGVFLPDPAVRMVSVYPNGNLRLAGTDEPRRPMNDFSSGNGYRVSMNFVSNTPLKKTDTLLGRLRGTRVVDELVLDVPFEQIADARPVESDGLTATVDVDPATGGRTAQLRVRLKGKPAALFADYRWSNSARQCVKVLGPNNEPMPIEVFTQRSGGDEVTLVVRSDMRAADFYDRLTTVSVRLPRALKAVDLPFKLDGVEFPDE